MNLPFTFNLSSSSIPQKYLWCNTTTSLQIISLQELVSHIVPCTLHIGHLNTHGKYISMECKHPIPSSHFWLRSWLSFAHFWNGSHAMTLWRALMNCFRRWRKLINFIIKRAQVNWGNYSGMGPIRPHLTLKIWGKPQLSLGPINLINLIKNTNKQSSAFPCNDLIACYYWYRA